MTDTILTEKGTVTTAGPIDVKPAKRKHREHPSGAGQSATQRGKAEISDRKPNLTKQTRLLTPP